LNGSTWHKVDTSKYREPEEAGKWTIGVFDSGTQAVRLMATNVYQDDFWDSSLSLWNLRSPAIQVSFDFAWSGIERDAIRALSLSGYASGTTAPFGLSEAGAAFYVWAWGSPIAGAIGPSYGSRWLKIDENAAGVGATDDLLLEWTSPSEAEARRAMSSDSVTVQVRPAQPARTDAAGNLPVVELNYAEVRIRYEH
jgi:hypothetical protein